MSRVNGILIIGSEMEVFILSGQSNMAGRGGVCHDKWDHILPEECHPHPSILRLDAHLNWVSAHEPLHADIDKKKVCGIGPRMVFANAILKAEKKSLIGLIPYAIGGTPIKEWEKGSTLYNNMIARTKAALQGTNGVVLRALLWYQWESDVEHESTAKTYQKNVEQLFNSIQSDLQSPNLLIIQDLNPTLSQINIDIPVGSFVAIVGSVGEGKSSLILAMLGEIPSVGDSEVTLRGRVAFVPQIS